MKHFDKRVTCVTKTAIRMDEVERVERGQRDKMANAGNRRRFCQNKNQGFLLNTALRRNLARISKLDFVTAASKAHH